LVTVQSGKEFHKIGPATKRVQPVTWHCKMKSIGWA